ncbi:MAG: DUF853 domain-containing protein [Taibaiella sp.]|nr:DUF853 domain-containing protein [Taibaiella sp.]
MESNQFVQDIQKGYSVKGKSFVLGTGVWEGNVYADAQVLVPLKMLNRHGLIAGATGTGKTKTLQLIAEQLSLSGIPLMMMDIKGDLSGLAAPGSANPFIEERYGKMNMAYHPEPFPVELLTLGGDPGSQMRATVSEFGPILLSKVLDLNSTQQGLLSILFKYADDHGLLLIDLKDLTRLLQYAGDEGKEEIQKDYGSISSSSLSTILRKIIALQQQGADGIFGELSFDIRDLVRTDPSGKGIISILRLINMQDRPAVFSTFMLQLLTELYQTLPEEGDLDMPKLIIFIDEAHLIFNEASKELMNQLESTIKLIRSKGVGIFFCTQNPQDVPADILGQLGMKVQHALRAFTANDRKNIQRTADNYPMSPYYQTDQLLTNIGIGEAVVTLLNEKGVPTPLVHTMMISPKSRMDILDQEEIDQIIGKSSLYPKYSQPIDKESAYEMLERRISTGPKQGTEKTKAEDKPKKEKSMLETVLTSSAGKQLQRSMTRTIFGVLEKGLKSLFK